MAWRKLESGSDEKIWAIRSPQAISELKQLKAVVLTPQAQGELCNPQQRNTV
ncbi:MAG: hypothetical protein JNK38_26785 [Acidobacteria bacterium]|nr:hypothetical protein [Acidobacteriota bacterium]